jgi:Na+-transporting NADH:ubiquinone oxidoreductase subunit C
MSTGVDRTRILAFTLAVTAFFGLLVSGLDSLLRSRKEMNSRVADQQVILQLFGLKPIDQPWTDESILGTFASQVETASGTTAGTGAAVIASGAAASAFTYYRPRTASGTKILVFPFKGKGFWDAIEGFLAVEARARRIVGIDFTRHAETPGLGGRISEPLFHQRFRGKPLTVGVSHTPVSFRLVSEGTARPETPEEIDGLTGATETSRAVERIVNDALRMYLPIILQEASL